MVPLPSASQILWTEVAVGVFLLCVLFRLYDELKTMVDLLYYETRALKDLRYSYQKSGKKMNPQQMAFIKKVVMKPTFWPSDKQRAIADWYLEQIMETGQIQEVETIDVRSSLVR